MNTPLRAVFMAGAELRDIGVPMTDARTAWMIPVGRAKISFAAGAAEVWPTTDFMAPADPAESDGRQPVAVPGLLSAPVAAARCARPRERVVTRASKLNQGEG